MLYVCQKCDDWWIIAVIERVTFLLEQRLAARTAFCVYDVNKSITAAYSAAVAQICRLIGR